LAQPSRSAEHVNSSIESKLFTSKESKLFRKPFAKTFVGSNSIGVTEAIPRETMPVWYGNSSNLSFGVPKLLLLLRYNKGLQGNPARLSEVQALERL